jgi:galactosamine-6-phosphate isomerase
MEVKIFKDHTLLAAYAADAMVQLLQQKPTAVVCMASGDSPKLTCELFCKKAAALNLDTSQLFFAGLDEWVGVTPGTYGSCHGDFMKRLIEPLGLAATQYHLFDAVAADIENECAVMDAIIAAKGGIDLMIVGIGMNGHIGFNEPGVDPGLLSHVIALDEMTVTVGQKYFRDPVVLQKGITLGLAHLLAAGKVFLLANGERKAPVIKRAVEEKFDRMFPAGIMQQHANGFILVDEAAGSLLNKL